VNREVVGGSHLSQLWAGAAVALQCRSDGRRQYHHHPLPWPTCSSQTHFPHIARERLVPSRYAPCCRLTDTALPASAMEPTTQLYGQYHKFLTRCEGGVLLSNSPAPAPRIIAMLLLGSLPTNCSEDGRKTILPWNQWQVAQPQNQDQSHALHLAQVWRRHRNRETPDTCAMSVVMWVHGLH
jgi:hypothetical protein